MMKKWIELLTMGQAEKQEEFDRILADSKAEVFAVMKYRRLQREQGRGKHITLDKLKDAYNDDIGLAGALSELFIEPIGKKEIDFIKERDIDIEKLYYRHIQDPNYRLITIALSI